ncbi:MAG: DUF4129 domain-containing protein [Pyrinomonadaceae bacterium]
MKKRILATFNMAEGQIRKKDATNALCSRHGLFAIGFLLLAVSLVRAIPVNDYHRKVQQALTALDTLSQVNETEDASAYDLRIRETVNGVLNLLPQTEIVEWNGTTLNVDNNWLHQELDKYINGKPADRNELLDRIKQRLKAIDERLVEIETPPRESADSKDEAKRKLAAILQRPEYARKIQQQSALTRLLKQFMKWLQNLFPKPKPVSLGTADLFSKIAQVFVIVLAVGVLVFVLRLFLPRLVRTRRKKKRSKPGARIVLGERLEPEQSATDLLSEAESLARRGELRAAIRKAYIALLVELGERKVISLAQHKTNRDYLRALRNVEPLYEHVRQLTDSFERHWYGFASATETDWLAFRSAYKQALSR